MGAKAPALKVGALAPIKLSIGYVVNLRAQWKQDNGQIASNHHQGQNTKAVFGKDGTILANENISDVGINISEKATVIWNVADVLRGPFKPHEYGLVILPMTVVKRFHADGKMAIIQNGSPLFSGDAESGPSEIRRYIIENDYLDAIIQLSTDMFMNTGISTYIWVLNKNKPAHRQGKVQLIDASGCAEPRRKSIGTKRNDITDLCRDLIVRAYGECRDGAVYGDSEGVHCESKVFDNIEFGYHKIVVERPLRLMVKINDETLEKLYQRLKRGGFDSDVPEMDVKEIFSTPIEKLPRVVRIPSEAGLKARFYFENALKILHAMKREAPYMDINQFERDFDQHPENKYGIEFNTLYRSSDLNGDLFEKNPEAEIVYDSKRRPEPDKDLRDTENIPLKEDIEEYFAREVLPYAPDAWIDKTKTKVGYEIPMTRYFYKYEAPEPVEAIAKRIKGLEKEIAESLEQLF